MNLQELAISICIAIGSLGIGILLGAALGAIMLRLAAYVLRFPDVPFPAAFRSTLIANGTILAINFMIGVNQGLMLGPMVGGRGGRYGDPSYLAMMFSPTFALLAGVVAILFAGLVYHKTLPKDREGHALSFTDGVLLATVQSALGITALALLAACVLGAIAGIWQMPGMQ